jgi:hypothetical protein
VEKRHLFIVKNKKKLQAVTPESIGQRNERTFNK